MTAELHNNPNATSEHESTISQYRVVDKEGNPTPPVIKLLDILQLPHDGTLDGIVAITQEKFFQRNQEGQRKERWELEEVMPEFRIEAIPVLDRLGMLREIPPSNNQYDGALMFGALVTRVRTRLAYLKELWKKGVRFNELIFLGGERPLAESGRETPDILYNRLNRDLPIRRDWKPQSEVPTTELGMMELVWDQADLPEDLRNVKIKWINAPMKPNPKGGRPLRPTTEDTLIIWLENSHPKDNYLAISNNPHIGYQHSVLETYLPKSINVETVGHRASLGLPMAFYLGEFARWLYQEKQRLSTSGVEQL